MVSDSIPLTRHVNIPYTVFTYILVNDFHYSRYLYAKLAVEVYYQILINVNAQLTRLRITKRIKYSVS